MCLFVAPRVQLTCVEVDERVVWRCLFVSRSNLQNREGMVCIASDTFDLSGDLPRLITFLNQSLKDHGFIFGLSKSGSRYSLAIYRTNEFKPPTADA